MSGGGRRIVQISLAARIAPESEIILPPDGINCREAWRICKWIACLERGKLKPICRGGESGECVPES